MKPTSITGLLLLLIICTTLSAQERETGAINGAEFEIFMPDNWNGGLVMYAHGYEETDAYRAAEAENEEEEDEEEEEGVNEFIQIFTSRGFAFAASGYKRKGLVIQDGVADTEALRRYFAGKYGTPNLSIITGHSMGGMISIATIEQFPANYDGALPLCGWLGPVYGLMKNALDMLVLYDYLFGTNDGKIVTDKALVSSEEIAQNLDKKEDLKALYSERFTIRQEDLPEMILFAQMVVKESTGWMGGLPVDNQKTIYSGFGNTDEALNASVKRYSGDPESIDYLIANYSPTGDIQDPVIALHTTYDEILPVLNYEYYEQQTRIQQTDHLYVPQYVVRDGHCYFTMEETGRAFDQLLNWIQKGEKPKIEFR